jgi:hypothetical protein
MYPQAIANIIKRIDSDDPDDAALYAVQTVTSTPSAWALRVHMSGEPWRLLVTLTATGSYELRADGSTRTRTVAPDDLLAAVRRMIYETDEAQAEGRYTAPRRSGIIAPPMTPPAHMDIPVWDDERGVWYDAEY